MPELPEVETIRLGLQKHLVGHKIDEVEVRDKKLSFGEKKAVVSAKVKAVRRAGKGLIIDLDNGYSIAIHIKLTGQLVYRDDKTKKIKPSEKYVDGLPSKFTRVIFHLDKSAFLFFNDVRRFAWMKVVKTQEVQSLPFFQELGPEPPVTGSISNKLTLEEFNNIASKANMPIKVLLMDQKKISGVGNIYANDALFDAGIDPRRKAKELKSEEIKKLYESVIKVLKKGLEEQGATEINFVNALGEAGSYQDYFLVYGREGEKCLECGSLIKKVKLAGRGTYFCERCQK